MSELLDNIKSQFGQANWLNRLLIINVAVFLAMVILGGFYWLITAGNLDPIFIDWLAIPSDRIELLYKPWTIITYMFVHSGFMHILFNMIILYFTGRIFIDFFGDKRILAVYMLGGIWGGLLFVILFNLSPAISAGAPMVGASAGVMAVLVATAAKAPNLNVRLFFILQVPLWLVAALFVVLDFAQMRDGNTGGHIAHLGGALFGYLYVQRMNRGKDWSNSFWNVIRWLSGLFERKPKLKTVHRKSSSGYAKTGRRQPSSSSYTSDQQRMDEILDKIKASGYDKLSKEEKDFLFKFSKK